MLRDNPLTVDEEFQGLVSMGDDLHLFAAVRLSLEADFVYEQLGKCEKTSALQLMVNIMRGVVNKQDNTLLRKVNHLMNDVEPIMQLQYLSAGFGSWKDEVIEVQYCAFVSLKGVIESSDLLLDHFGTMMLRVRRKYELDYNFKTKSSLPSGTT